MPNSSLRLDIAEITPRFPDFRVAAVLVENLVISPERPPFLDELIAEREARTRELYGASDLSEIPGIAAWRNAYKGFGIKKTSYRCSVERLVKRVKAGDRLPVVNTLVDIYNTVSLSHVFCCGADDADRITPDLAFRYARPGDSFVDMGVEGGAGGEDPPKEGEVVYADSRHVLCRRWNWRQDARTGITADTRRAIVTVQANGWGDLDAAVRDLEGLLRDWCRADVRVAVADARDPAVVL